MAGGGRRPAPGLESGEYERRQSADATFVARASSLLTGAGARESAAARIRTCAGTWSTSCRSFMCFFASPQHPRLRLLFPNAAPSSRCRLCGRRLLRAGAGASSEEAAAAQATTRRGSRIRKQQSQPGMLRTGKKTHKTSATSAPSAGTRTYPRRCAFAGARSRQERRSSSDEGRVCRLPSLVLSTLQPRCRSTSPARQQDASLAAAFENGERFSTLAQIHQVESSLPCTYSYIHSVWIIIMAR